MIYWRLRSGIEITDAPMWRAVWELYYKDLVVEAAEEAERLGGLNAEYVMAEADTRRNSHTWDIGAWLTIEAIPAEAPPGFDLIRGEIKGQCDLLSRDYGWDNREATVVTFLPRSYDAAWMPGRWGYFVDKTPYDKICLPHHLLDDPPRLRESLRHEFMHGITLNLCNGHDPRWFAEAMATLAEGRINAEAWHSFQDEPRLWLSPVELVGILGADQRDETKSDGIGLAYEQSAFIGRWLYGQGGAARLQELMRSLGDESVLHNLQSAVLGRSRMDSALRHVYEISEEEAFVQTLAWVKSSKPAEPVYGRD